MAGACRGFGGLGASAPARVRGRASCERACAECESGVGTLGRACGGECQVHRSRAPFALVRHVAAGREPPTVVRATPIRAARCQLELEPLPSIAASLQPACGPCRLPSLPLAWVESLQANEEGVAPCECVAWVRRQGQRAAAARARGARRCAHACRSSARWRGQWLARAAACCTPRRCVSSSNAAWPLAAGRWPLITLILARRRQ